MFGANFEFSSNANPNPAGTASSTSDHPADSSDSLYATADAQASEILKSLGLSSPETDGGSQKTDSQSQQADNADSHALLGWLQQQKEYAAGDQQNQQGYQNQHHQQGNYSNSQYGAHNSHLGSGQRHRGNGPYHQQNYQNHRSGHQYQQQGNNSSTYNSTNYHQNSQYQNHRSYNNHYSNNNSNSSSGTSTVTNLMNHPAGQQHKQQQYQKDNDSSQQQYNQYHAQQHQAAMAAQYNYYYHQQMMMSQMYGKGSQWWGGHGPWSQGKNGVQQYGQYNNNQQQLHQKNYNHHGGSNGKNNSYQSVQPLQKTQADTADAGPGGSGTTNENNTQQAQSQNSDQDQQPSSSSSSTSFLTRAKDALIKGIVGQGQGSQSQQTNNNNNNVDFYDSDQDPGPLITDASMSSLLVDALNNTPGNIDKTTAQNMNNENNLLSNCNITPINLNILKQPQTQQSQSQGSSKPLLPDRTPLSPSSDQYHSFDLDSPQAAGFLKQSQSASLIKGQGSTKQKELKVSNSNSNLNSTQSEAGGTKSSVVGQNAKRDLGAEINQVHVESIIQNMTTMTTMSKDQSDCGMMDTDEKTASTRMPTKDVEGSKVSKQGVDLVPKLDFSKIGKLESVKESHDSEEIMGVSVKKEGDNVSILLRSTHQPAATPLKKESNANGSSNQTSLIDKESDDLTNKIGSKTPIGKLDMTPKIKEEDDINMNDDLGQMETTSTQTMSMIDPGTIGVESSVPTKKKKKKTEQNLESEVQDLLDPEQFKNLLAAQNENLNVNQDDILDPEQFKNLLAAQQASTTKADDDTDNNDIKTDLGPEMIRIGLAVSKDSHIVDQDQNQIPNETDLNPPIVPKRAPGPRRRRNTELMDVDIVNDESDMKMAEQLHVVVPAPKNVKRKRMSTIDILESNIAEIGEGGEVAEPPSQVPTETAVTESQEVPTGPKSATTTTTTSSKPLKPTKKAKTSPAPKSSVKNTSPLPSMAKSKAKAATAAQAKAGKSSKNAGNGKKK